MRNYSTLRENILQKKYIISFIGLLLLSSFYLSLSFSKGGRWTLNQNIAMAERVIDLNGTAYDSKDFQISSVYFPGVYYICYGLYFFIHDAKIVNNILLILPFILIILFTHLACRLSQISYLKSVTICTSLLFLNFPTAHKYISELKPDLIIIILSFLLINLNLLNKKMSLKISIFLFLFFILIGIFKQQGVAIYIGYALLLLFLNIKPSEKVKSLLPPFFSGLIVLFILFIHEGAIDITVKAMKSHGFLDRSTSIKFIIKFLKNNFIFLFFLILALRKSKTIPKEFYKIIILFCPWIFIQILSTFKVGGNEGNLEIAFLPLIPIVINIIHNKLSNLKIRKIYFISVLTLIFIKPIVDIKNNLKYLKKNKRRIERAIGILSKYDLDKVIINSTYYMDFHDITVTNFYEYNLIKHLGSTNIPNHDGLIGFSPKALNLNSFNYNKVNNKPLIFIKKELIAVDSLKN
jgi:hypothetical protein